MSYRLGTGYIGSPELQQTSTTNFQVIPEKPLHWTKGYNCYKFSFINPNQPCTIKINDNDPIWINISQGFNSDSIDSPIWSFIILEFGIDFNWIGAY